MLRNNFYSFLRVFIVVANDDGGEGVGVGVVVGGGGVCVWFFKTEFFCVTVLAVLASAL